MKNIRDDNRKAPNARFPSIGRREFVAGLAAAGAAAMLPQIPSAAQAPARPFRIDTHHHVASPGFIAEIVKRNTGQRPLIEWTAAASIADMDKASVATAILSTSEPGVWFGDDAASAVLARECNEFTARVIADYPGRFGMFAIVPLPYIDGALKEMEYSLDTLKADGICMMTSYNAKYLGDPMFTPVMQELNRRKGIVYFHPFRAECCKSLQPEMGPAVIELGTDTTRNIASLIFSGNTARFPDIRFLFSHGGGTFPYLMNRFLGLADRPDMKAKLPNGLLHEVQKLYYDTANFFNPYALPTLMKTVPVSQVLYGTDYPFGGDPSGRVAAGLRTHPFTAAELRAIERDNALRLFPRLARG